MRKGGGKWWPGDGEMRVVCPPWGWKLPRSLSRAREGFFSPPSPGRHPNKCIASLSPAAQVLASRWIESVRWRLGRNPQRRGEGTLRERGADVGAGTRPFANPPAAVGRGTETGDGDRVMLGGVRFREGDGRAGSDRTRDVFSDPDASYVLRNDSFFCPISSKSRRTIRSFGIALFEGSCCSFLFLSLCVSLSFFLFLFVCLCTH